MSFFSTTTLRTWATPLTMGAFLLLAVTGVLMFFHLDRGLNKFAHEWLSWALLAGAAVHVTVNWNAFKMHLKRPMALGIVALFAVLLGLSFIGPKGGSPVRAVMDGVSDAPLVAVATIAKKTPDEIATLIKGAGLSATNPATDTLATLAAGDRKKVHEALNLIFAP